MLKIICIKFITWLAKRAVAKYQPRIVAVVGSMGKTSAKEAILTVLQQKFRVRGTVKNYNTELGVSLAILGVAAAGRNCFKWLRIFGHGLKLCFWKQTDYPEILVLEYGADRPGDIRRLLALAVPEVAVVTAVGLAHIEFFGSLDKIAREKIIVPQSVSASGLVILNYDNKLVLDMSSKLKAPVKTYGLIEGADLRAIEVGFWEVDDEYPRSLNGMRAKVIAQGSMVPISVAGAIGYSIIRATLVALSVGEYFGLHIVEMTSFLSALQPPPGRMRLIPGIKGSMLIDDTYNASPEATESAVRVLGELPPSRKIVVLGDMLELGHEAVNAHHTIGKLVTENHFDLLVTVGKTARLIGVAAQHRGLDHKKIVHFDKPEAAGLYLQKIMQKGDVILIKGSQAIRMEKVVKELMAEPLRANELLVRQEPHWLKD